MAAQIVVTARRSCAISIGGLGESARAATAVDVESNVRIYLGDRDAMIRCRSFGYCYNCFQAYRESDDVKSLAAPAEMQLSCLQLEFYLASCGMLRSSSILLRKSSQHYVPAFQAIAHTPTDVWDIDCHNYSTQNVQLILETAARIRVAFQVRASDVLVTKVMLGVYGCVPAFGAYFVRGFRPGKFGAPALRRLVSSTPRTVPTSKPTARPRSTSTAPGYRSGCIHEPR